MQHKPHAARARGKAMPNIHIHIDASHLGSAFMTVQSLKRLLQRMQCAEFKALHAQMLGSGSCTWKPPLGRAAMCYNTLSWPLSCWCLIPQPVKAQSHTQICPSWQQQACQQSASECRLHPTRTPCAGPTWACSIAQCAQCITHATGQQLLMKPCCTCPWMRPRSSAG